MNGTIFEGGGTHTQLLNINCVFWFSLQLLSSAFIILRTERDKNKNVFIVDLSLSYQSYSLWPRITRNLSEDALLKAKSNAFVNNENYLNN